MKPLDLDQHRPLAPGDKVLATVLRGVTVLARVLEVRGSWVYVEWRGGPGRVPVVQWLEVAEVERLEGWTE